MNSINDFIDKNIENIENYLLITLHPSLPLFLLNDEGIISIVTLNNPYVMR